jgi:hypothetical protein
MPAFIKWQCSYKLRSFRTVPTSLFRTTTISGVGTSKILWFRTVNRYITGMTPDSKSSDEESSDEASDPVADTMSHPEVGPSDEVLDKFWKRVAELTTRYHDVHNKWIGGPEVQEWNKTNRTVSAAVNIPCMV